MAQIFLLGASFTSLKNGRVQELENALQYIWNNYQAGVSTIWGSADAVTFLDDAIRYSGTQPTAYRFQYARDEQNQLLGGFVVSAIINGTVRYRRFNVPPALKFVVCVPEYEVSTEKARALLPKMVPLRDAVENLNRVALITSIFANGVAA